MQNATVHEILGLLHRGLHVSCAKLKYERTVAKGGGDKNQCRPIFIVSVRMRVVCVRYPIFTLYTGRATRSDFCVDISERVVARCNIEKLRQ